MYTPRIEKKRRYSSAYARILEKFDTRHTKAKSLRCNSTIRLLVDAGRAHGGPRVDSDVASSRVVSNSRRVRRRRRAAPATQHVRQTAAEVVGQQRVEQRIEAAVEVVEDERERRNDELPVGELRLTERLPQDTHVVRQDADGERDDDGD